MIFLSHCLILWIQNVSNKKIRVFALISGGNHPEMFLGKGVLKICSKFTGKHPCGSAILIKLLRKKIYCIQKKRFVSLKKNTGLKLVKGPFK